ncbi:MAG: hypothetical protein DU429_01595 [Candidatus Tokpelaia sp.]|nr:MAG: hypothetical protein DU430_03225 [Candidatus Tokpelaia sp.]KAA6207749.1 MAG: hypothetical protein DU429_01595 [Candidatus Tokpelaia sp.]
MAAKRNNRASAAALCGETVLPFKALFCTPPDGEVNYPRLPLLLFPFASAFVPRQRGATKPCSYSCPSFCSASFSACSTAARRTARRPKSPKWG